VVFDPDSPQLLAKFVTEVEAALLVNHLARHGIKAYIAGVGSATGWTEAPGEVQVLIRQADLSQAKGVLDHIRGGNR
jgi:hypothetical protein